MDQEEKVYEIRGAVIGSNGAPLRAARVVVWWQQIRERKELAAGKTSGHGTYHLTYKVPKHAPQPLLLVVEALSKYLDAPLFSPLTQAQPTLQIDLNFEPPDQSEWATLVRSIEPLLGGLKLSELIESSTNQDISFLATELSKSTEVVMRVALSARLETAFKIPAPAFYAFLCQQVPASLPNPLLDASQNFTLIAPLLQNVASLIFGLSANVQTQTITAAISLDLIGPQFTKQISQLVSELQALHTTDLLKQPYLVGNATLAQLLDVASIPQAKQQAFAQALASNTETMSELWQTLAKGTSGLTAADASSIQSVLSIGSFIQNFVPLTQILFQRFAAGTYTTMADLARLSLSDWTALVGQTGAPPGIDATETASAAQVFASLVYARMTSAYPTAALSSRIATAKLVPREQQGPLTLFLTNNAGLELITDNITAYLAAQGTQAFAGIGEGDQPAVIANLRSFQRVLRVAPAPDVAQVLLSLGLNSATKIAAMGDQQFYVRAAAAGLTKPEASQVFQAAASRYANVVSLYMKFNQDALGIWPQAIGQISDLAQPVEQAIGRDQSLATLFGSQDFCAIDDCTSVLSPAAYLCDLLLWLRNHALGAGTALDVLDSRRPDIRHLLLNCPNSDTELPYIDLVIELLADKISPPTDPNSTINPQWKQTSEGLSAAQLSAAPQYFNQEAYNTLAIASYPQTLPYSAGLDELRTYLQQWNLPLWQLRQALLPVAGGSAGQQAAVTAERLGMNSQAENLVITPNATAAFLATVWNTSDFSATPPTGLASVPVFLQAAGITYESLLELLEVSWVQGGLGIELVGLNDTCDTSSMALSPAPLDPQFLDRAHRFLRLWIATSYKMWELDLLLNAPRVGGGVLGQNTLIALQDFWQLQKATGLTVEQQLAFYQNIDTNTHRELDGSTTTSLYSQLFLNPALTWSNPDADIATLATGGTPADPLLSDHLPAIQAALGISAADATILSGLTDNQLTLDNLSLMYRVNALAVASRLKISDLLNFVRLLSPVTATPSTTLASAITNAQQTTITVASVAPFPPANFYIQIAGEVLLVTGMSGPGNTTWTVLRAQSGTTAGASAPGTPVTSDTASPAPTFTALFTSPTTTLAFLAQASAVQTQSSLTADALTYVLTPPSAITGGWTTTTQMTEANIAAALGAIQTAVASANGSNITGTVVSAVAANAHPTNATAVASDATALVLSALQVPNTSQKLVDVLTDPAFTGANSPITRANYPEQFLAIQLFDKVAVLVRRLNLVATPDLTWLLNNAAVYGGLDFSHLPVATGQPALSLAPLLTTLLVIKQARLWTAAPPSSSLRTLYDVITGVATGSADEGTTQKNLATITGWPLADINAFAVALSPAFPAEYTQPATYDALRTLEAMANMAGASGAQIVKWGTVPADEPTAKNLADDALGALKAHQPDDAWLILAPTVMNPIRERRSAALQAYLIAQRDASGKFIYGDANGLFDYFLIDVQMSSCEGTSRVVQAYIAVQIFVERCLMNLEAPDVIVDLTKDDTWNQWEWMKRYRIWEANREVFLYPENWLIESQRPNRTEIYQKFEQEVRQGESTTDYLETVVLNYIDRLDGLAHLHVTGTCQDPAGNIYVVARTLDDPPVFYLRSFVNGAWTGWAQIPLDIKARQVIPAIYRGRVCLFWIDLKVSNEPHQELPATQASPNPPHQEVDRYVTIAVYFSIFRNGSWAPAQTSKGKLFDKPLLTSQAVSDTKTVEALYTLKVQTPATAPGSGADLFVDVFRLGKYAVTTVTLTTIVKNGPSVTNTTSLPSDINNSVAVHIGRAAFDGRFSDLELRNLGIPYSGLGDVSMDHLLSHAQQVYGPAAQTLMALTTPDPDLVGEPNLLPIAGALVSPMPTTFLPPGYHTVMPLTFTPANGLEMDVGTLLNDALVPFRIVGPDTDLNFDPGLYFFYQDNRRCYYVESRKSYPRGKIFLPVTPAKELSAVTSLARIAPVPPSGVFLPFYPPPYLVRYWFHFFYHPFTRLFWNQLGSGGFDLLYDPSQQIDPNLQLPYTNLQENPDQVDPSGADKFSFGNNYLPVTSRVNWDHDDVTGEDRQFLDFRYDAAFGVYNWELFYHIPLFIAQLLSQNQQFEDAQKWFHYIFNPTRQATNASTTLAAGITDTQQTSINVVSAGGFPSPYFPVSIGAEVLFVTAVSGSGNTTWTVLRGQQGTTAAAAAVGTTVTLSDLPPQRFWIPKPLHNLTSSQILAQQINNLLAAVNQGDPASVAEVENWRNNSFNPFLLADLRQGVPYMKSTVMSYLDNLIAWGDNLFSTESREALSEATLIYVLASEILGPTPTAVTPPMHSDESFDQLEPSLDAFANAMVEIENVIGGTGTGGSGAGTGGGIPTAQTFYFKIPPNATLLNYWTTVADRLYKLRHCQNIAGAPLQLALFDAPIDPGLLIKGQAASIDLSSVLSDITAALPNYRFTALYPQALDFVNAVRAYGSLFQAALEKSDAGAFTLLQQTTQHQLLVDGNDVLDRQVQQAQNAIEVLQANLDLGNQRLSYYTDQSHNVINFSESYALTLSGLSVVLNSSIATAEGLAAGASMVPYFTFGAAGFGGSPTADAGAGGKDAAEALKSGALAVKAIADAMDKTAAILNAIGKFSHTADDLGEKIAETNIDIKHTNRQLAGAQLALEIAQRNQALHQEQIDNFQKQIDFLNNKFTNDDLYNWMISSLSATYFQSYQLAYQMCKQVERCYQFELGIEDSSFIQFGYWDSLHKGLLAGETLNHDLRRMQASYLQQNARRYELSRFVSLASLPSTNPNYITAIQELLVTGSCDFSLPESLFDSDYPGHYNRRLTRASVTVVYPSPGKFDNVKATLTLSANRVRVKTDISSGYAEQPAGSDPRFLYSYAANSQKIALGNAQDDPGLFITAIASNIADQRYLPFENAGAISSWHLEMPQINNEVDLSTVGDVMLHFYYTALDGGMPFQTAVQADNAANLPTSGIKVFSAQNDFAASAASVANPYPLSPWQAFLTKPFVAFTTLAWPITASQTSIVVASNTGFPAPGFNVSIGSEILEVTAVAGTTWTVARGQQGTTASSASEEAIVLIPSPAGSQVLTLAISPLKFPPWTRGKTISVSSLTVVAVAWTPGSFVLAPQAPLPTALVNLLPVAGVTEPNICSGTIALPANTPLGTWSFELQAQGAADFHSLTKNSIADVLLLVNYQVS